MKELEKKNNDLEIVNQVNKQQEKQTKHVGTIYPHGGHKCFEWNLDTGEIKEAEYNQEAVSFMDAKRGIKSINRKVIVKENCKYLTALNLKNAKKHFFKQYNLGR